MSVLIRNVLRKLRAQRGQMIIMFVGIFTIIGLMAAVTIDFGLWFSERRGAQTDADLSALAGAWELLDPGATETDAVTAAENHLVLNDESGNASLAQPVDVGEDCFPGDDLLDSVTVDVNHESRSLFAGFFDVVEPDIGAHAMACAGAATGLGDVVPFEMPNTVAPCFNADRTPNFTTLCGLEFGAQAENPRGLLDLGTADGIHCSESGRPADIDSLIENGAPGSCFINVLQPPSCDPVNNGPWFDCVAVQTGNPRDVLVGTSRRIAREGLCDINFHDASGTDGIDDFSESVELVIAPDTYQARDCDPATEGVQISPRLITIIVLNEVPIPGNTGYPIWAFAGFRLAGCAFDPDEPLTSEDDLTFDERKCIRRGQGAPPGLVAVYGQFVKLIVSGETGPPSGGTTMFSISLVE